MKNKQIMALLLTGCMTLGGIVSGGNETEAKVRFMFRRNKRKRQMY